MSKIETDILKIMSVHPMKQSALKTILSEHGYDWNIIEELIRLKKIVQLEYNGEIFYLRNLKDLSNDMK